MYSWLNWFYLRFFAVVKYFYMKPHHNVFPYYGTYYDDLRWGLYRRKARWPSWIDDRPKKVQLSRTRRQELRVTFINHSTVLLQINGINILADPIWSYRCGPFPWFGMRRVRRPGVSFKQLPPIDFVLVSHNHYDHMDVPTLKKLAKRDRPHIFAGVGNKHFLEVRDIPGCREMEWWQSVELPNNLRLTFVPAQHSSGRDPIDKFKTLWGGFIIQSEIGAIYFAGDTAYFPLFAQLREKFAPIKLAILPIGAYKPRWYIKGDHMDPADAVLAHLDLGAELSMGVHFGTFQLADEPFEEPETMLRAEMKNKGLPENSFWVPQCGEFRSFAPSKLSMISILPTTTPEDRQKPEELQSWHQTR